MLVEQLGLNQNQNHCWPLLSLFADATDEEAGIKEHSGLCTSLMDNHTKGYLDQIIISCPLMWVENTIKQGSGQDLQSLLKVGMVWYFKAHHTIMIN